MLQFPHLPVHESRSSLFTPGHCFGIASFLVVAACSSFANADLAANVLATLSKLWTWITTISGALFLVVVGTALVLRMISFNPDSIKKWTNWAKGAAITFAILMCIGVLYNFVMNDVLSGVTGVGGDEAWSAVTEAD